MKLLAKLNIRYISYSITVMLFSGIAIYFILSVIIAGQMDEQLAGTLQTIEKQLNKTPGSFFIEPFAQVSKIENGPETTVLSDTLIYNEQEKELEEFRQLTAIKNIGGNYFSIKIRKSKIESDDLLETLALVTVLAMLLLTATLILVNRKVAKSVWLPFYRNLKIVEQFTVNGKTPVSLVKSEITEFDQLNSVITGLTKQVISDFQNQKQFSEDVSHELQTPLAIISSQLETLLSDGGLNGQHAEKLKSIYSSVRRLARLNKDLILLAKIENNQFASFEETNLKEVFLEKLDAFSELVKLKKLSIETTLPGDFIIPAPPALAEILVNNLLSNSINHNIKGGKIRLEMNGNQLFICNSGATKITEPQKLFTRFYKAEPSSQSVGLGLAIVKKICDLHHIGIEYHFTGGFHCFTLKTGK